MSIDSRINTPHTGRVGRVFKAKNTILSHRCGFDSPVRPTTHGKEIFLLPVSLFVGSASVLCNRLACSVNLQHCLNELALQETPSVRTSTRQMTTLAHTHALHEIVYRFILWDYEKLIIANS